jgi:fructoselysine 6-kinase
VLDDLRLSDADLTFIRQHDILAAHFDPTEPEVLFHQVIVEFDCDGVRVADFGDWSYYDNDYGRLVSYLEHLDLVFISGSETTVDALLPLSRRFNGLIVVTLGAEGSVALVDGVPQFQPAQYVPTPVDPTGCGDAYQAAFTVAYYRTGSVEGALCKGAAQAARVLQHYGAID